MLSTAACVLRVALAVTLLSTCEAFRWDSAKLLSPLGSPVGPLLQYEGSGQGQLIQDSSQLKPSQRLHRTKRHRQLVRTQPHLVHHMAVPEIEESSRADAGVKLSPVRQGAARTRVDEEMERMVHLGAPPGPEIYRGRPRTPEADKELLNGQEAEEESQEASGFNGSDLEGGESREPRGRQNERGAARGGRPREGGAGEVLDALEANQTAVDLDALIGYQRPFDPIASQRPGVPPPAELHGSALQLRPEASAEVDADLHPSSRGAARLSVRTSGSTSDAPTVAGATGTYETDTDTDFWRLQSYLQGIGLNGGGEEEEEGAPLTTHPSTTVSFTDTSWDQMAKVMPWPAQRSEVGGGGVTEIFLPGDHNEAQQVVCLTWTDLVERGYVVLNMTHNMNCEEFRVDQGVRLLKIMDQVFARRMKSPEGSWILYLSKPTHQQPQLLMNVASDRGVMNTNDVLTMLGEIRNILPEVGVQNFSAAVGCSFPTSQKRSDYSKLFVVLVVIGSVCTVIITSGSVYICWQRRLPATKTTFHADELRFVENGCHDNPTLDVASDGQHEMRKKKPDSNGLPGEGAVAREEANRWQVFVNQAVAEEQEEEDTHL
ncbi:podocalyxin-like protein 2 [Takifugu flavidus]|uniref:podocalyxin-like protein 2 n=1 Tax=Takifugu flavidus TaxID=433684 RepID=UPI002544007E|nr:podocalyxin-like protein 2 [Takifugu flavidus]